MSSRLLGTFAGLLSLLAVSLVSGTAAQAIATRTITVTITHVECIDSCRNEGLEAAAEGPADLYAKVWINGQKQPPGSSDDDPSTPHEDDKSLVTPYWVLPAQVPDTVLNIPVSIQIWDHDSSSGDDLGDISPRNGDNTLDFRVDHLTGKWIDHTGNEDKVNWPQSCAVGDGDDDDEPRVKVCFDISIDSSNGDTDGDFLLDGWERWGYNADGDSTIDVDLPAMGANFRRKDLYLEIDCLFGANHNHCPVQGAVQTVVQSFADAPVLNADGSSGIQLHVDMGNFYGQAAGVATNVPRAGGGAVGTFGNYGGGGNQINEATNMVVDWDGAPGQPATNFFTLKNMNPARDFVFRYALSGHQTNARAAANDCTSGQAKGIPGVNFMVTLGGTNAAGNACWGTNASGQSVGTQDQQAGTLMHEFGHVLGLQHGGRDEFNNKPNYLGVMNYTFQACGVTAVPAAGLPGGCDYSRIALGPLNEVLPPGLDECMGIGIPALGGVDWNGVGGMTGASCAPATGNVSANINDDTSNDINNDGDQDPGEPPLLSRLDSFEDWNRLFYGFRTIENFRTAGAPVQDEPDPHTVEAARDNLATLVKPELKVDVTGPADATPGDTLTYTTSLDNPGRGPSLRTRLGSENVDTVVAGGSVSRTETVEVPCDTADGTVLTRSASAGGEDMLGNRVSGSDSLSTTVHAPRLTVGKTATATVNAGEAITYRIAYENTGSGDASGVTVTDVLPADVYYSKALDTGAGPQPSTVVRNADGTTTLTWRIGAAARGSGEKTIEYTARPSLLFLPGDELTNSATLTFTNQNDCTYEPVKASAATKITEVPATRNPRSQGYWKTHQGEWTSEILARIQATDQRFDTGTDGALSEPEVTAVFAPGDPHASILRVQLLGTYFNLAARKINASTVIRSETADRHNLHNVRGAALFGIRTLALPVSGNTGIYSDAIRVLDEINNNRSEVY
ncbi:putative repeat protein (TIGR01451 family) [Nonomuraea polychroma]|uniref:Putative repeat protein (TIGR01451 family) n=1 Tax=Nonomuraea polychroma TaxID=46176 RepID=A0A438M6V1_9ACTN|nr:DUF11 domain-containing protein [Nonomuraea polychroma]RVX41432.1 putative repeat protein (TIGR01451 family) [Nonomuraea polychroma]